MVSSIPFLYRYQFPFAIIIPLSTNSIPFSCRKSICDVNGIFLFEQHYGRQKRTTTKSKSRKKNQVENLRVNQFHCPIDSKREKWRASGRSEKENPELRIENDWSFVAFDFPIGDFSLLIWKLLFASLSFYNTSKCSFSIRRGGSISGLGIQRGKRNENHETLDREK